MEALGINWSFLLIQILVIVVYPGLTGFALFSLRHTHGTNTVKVFWAILIIAIPILGALAFFVTENGNNNNREK